MDGAIDAHLYSFAVAKSYRRNLTRPWPLHSVLFHSAVGTKCHAKAPHGARSATAHGHLLMNATLINAAPSQDWQTPVAVEQAPAWPAFKRGGLPLTSRSTTMFMAHLATAPDSHGNAGCPDKVCYSTMQRGTGVRLGMHCSNPVKAPNSFQVPLLSNSAHCQQ